MRVLHVLDHSLPLHSGYTFRTRAILKAQQAAGIAVAGVTGVRHVVKGDPVERETVDGLDFFRTAGEPGGPPGLREWREIAMLAARTEAVARQWGADVLHAHSPALNGMAAARAAKRLGLPLVYEIRAFWEDAAVGNGTSREGSTRYWLTRQLENRAIALADAIVTICEGLKLDLIARGVAADRITVSPNGVDLSLFGTPVPPKPALRRALGLEGADVIGFIGSFYDYEGLDDLVAAMPALLHRLPQAKLLLVGGGPREAALQAQVAALGIDDKVHFAGRVPHDQVERYYSLIDVLAYPRKAMRLTELVTPLKPLEAMAQGRLVAASDVGGHRELIEDGITGTLFPAGDPQAIAAALAELFEDRAIWPIRRERAFAFVARERDWALNVQRYQPVYQELVAKDKERSKRAA